MNRALLVMLTLEAAALTPAWAMDVVVAGQPHVTLVIPEVPLPVQKAAAEELQYHVKRASGAELPIIREVYAKDTDSNVFIGPCKRTLALGLWPQETKPNGYVI